jgi:hypothetical protein
VAVLAIVLALAGIRFIAAPIFVSTPDTVHIVVTEVQLPSANTTVIFDHQFSHQASAIYARLTAGVRYDNAHIASCPGIPNQLPYYQYRLTFFHLGITVATASNDARGCAAFTVKYPDGSVAQFSWGTSSHASFWVYLHQVVNAPEPINTYGTT